MNRILCKFGTHAGRLGRRRGGWGGGWWWRCRWSRTASPPPPPSPAHPASGGTPAPSPGCQPAVIMNVKILFCFPRQDCPIWPFQTRVWFTLTMIWTQCLEDHIKTSECWASVRSVSWASAWWWRELWADTARSCGDWREDILHPGDSGQSSSTHDDIQLPDIKHGERC